MQEGISRNRRYIEEIEPSVKINVEAKIFLTQNILRIQETIKRPNLRIIETEEDEESQLPGPENIFNKITEEKYPNLKNKMSIKVQKQLQEHKIDWTRKESSLTT